IPLLLRIVEMIYNRHLSGFSSQKKQVQSMYMQAAILLWLLCGILVPASLILSSPIEFAFTGSVENPLSYVANSAAVFFGLWVVWPLFIFLIAPKKMRGILAFLFNFMALTALCNLYVFRGNYETVNKLLLFDNPSLLDAGLGMTVLPLLCSALIALAILYVLKHNRAKLITGLLTILVLTSVVSGGYSIWQISQEYKDHARNLQENAQDTSSGGDLSPVVNLSKDGENVFVLFLDRAISSFFPIALEQFPELREQYEGFVYYPNSIAYGPSTLTGAPPIMGGYEYTPDAINKRDSEKLVTKHNEATLVLPRIFLEADYAVTVVDPPFANYKWASDFSAFKPYPEIDVMQLEGAYSIKYKLDHKDVLDWDPMYESNTIYHRFPIFSILKTTLPLIRKTLYDSGKYFLMQENPQNNDSFINAYALLHYLPQITTATSEKSTYTFYLNDTAHAPLFLQAPEYVPVDNPTDTSSPLSKKDGYPEMTQKHYHAFIAAIRSIGTWLDSLKALGVYDNTRLVIVADHGKDIVTPAFKDFSGHSVVLGSYNPLLLIKDFNAKGNLREDSQFMTTADVPTIVVQDLPVSTVNPFTGIDLFSVIDKSSANVYYVHWNPKKNLGTQFEFEMDRSFTVHDSVFEESNWNPMNDRE
ncbi:hypothetical protein, partial [Sphaerochaeta sp. S2]|uniref:hypothetical protein n=1 Tax=Sphaerochaeta sp. S2 TaxID=2798868 RepID=UPI0018E91B10